MKLIKKKLQLLPIPERKSIVDKHYEIKAERHFYEGERIVVATIWYSCNEEPTYRVFIAEESYITQVFDNKKEPWSGAMLNHHIKYGYFWYMRRNDEYKTYSDEQTLELLREVCGISNKDEESALWLINYRQSSIREKKIRDKEAREQAVWDAELVTTPEEPKGLNEWAKDNIFVRERYIFYETTKSKEKHGKCSFCGQEVKVFNPRGKQIGECPNCHSQVEYRNGNKQKYLNSDRKNMALVQMTTTGRVVIRIYKWCQDITINAWNEFVIKRTQWETKRIFVDVCRNMKSYDWELYKNRFHRFVPVMSSGYCISDSCYANTYIENYEEIMNYLKGGMEYLPKEMFEDKIDISRLLKSQGLTGMVERLWKMGLHKLASDITNSYTQYIGEKTLFKAYEAENDDLRIFKAVDIELKELCDWPKIKKTGKALKAEDIEQMRTIGLTINRLSEINKYSSNKKIIKYLTEQNAKRIDIQLYKDYLDMLKSLNMDTKSEFNLSPRNLRQRHDELVEIQNEQNNAKLKKKLDKTHSAIAAMEDELNKKYAVETKEYFIRAPHSAYEIALEGQKLHHCVGGDRYRDGMKSGELFILFVRKKSEPDTPWWTIEVRSNHAIAQYHGWGNRDKDKGAVEPIMRKFRKRLEKLKKDEEKAKVAIAAAV